jgi:hypothetical protein
MRRRSLRNSRAAGINIALAGREPDPVLEAVDEYRGSLVGVDQE